MPSIAEQLTKLKDDRDRIAKDQQSAKSKIAAATKALGENQADLDRLTARQRIVDDALDATAKLEQAATVATSATADVCKRTEADLAKVQQKIATLKSRVEQELSDARRRALTLAVEAIDKRIAEAEEKAEKKSTELVTAGATLSAAGAEAKAADEKYADALRRLQAVPKGLDAKRAQAFTDCEVAIKAVDSGRMAEGYLRVTDLEVELGELEALRKKASDQDPTGELPPLWQAKMDTAVKLRDATAALSQLQADATAAEREKDALIANRDRDIMKVLTDPAVPANPDADADVPIVARKSAGSKQ